MKNNFFLLLFKAFSLLGDFYLIKICTFKYCMNLIIYNASKEVERVEEFKE
jgi:hypothetical protein